MASLWAAEQSPPAAVQRRSALHAGKDRDGAGEGDDESGDSLPPEPGLKNTGTMPASTQARPPVAPP